jgi:hypothetical protein
VTAGHLLDEGSELADLRLTHSAGSQWAVEHEDKQLDATAGTVNVREQGCPDISRCVSSKSPATPSLTIKAAAVSTIFARVRSPFTVSGRAGTV